jgi:hypothetical protein
MAEKEDHGSDLLELSLQVNASANASSTVASHSEFDDVRILVREGLLDEAKRRIRARLAQSPDWVQGRELLEEIHERELEDLLKRPEISERVKPPHREDASHGSLPSLISRLEADLGISPRVYAEGGKRAKADFLDSVLRQTKDLNGSVIQDLGIGFLEMGLPDVAAALFRRSAEVESGLEIQNRLLELLAWIEQGRHADSIPELLALWTRDPIADSARKDCARLLSRAYRLGENTNESQRWHHVWLQMEAS